MRVDYFRTGFPEVTLDQKAAIRQHFRDTLTQDQRKYIFEWDWNEVYEWASNNRDDNSLDWNRLSKFGIKRNYDTVVSRIYAGGARIMIQDRTQPDTKTPEQHKQHKILLNETI
jgi:hypothetical protein